MRKKKGKGYAISEFIIWRSAALGDRFDVNLKAYSHTSYSNNKRGSSTQPKITRPANRILPSFLPVIRFVLTPLRKITNDCVLIDCPTAPRDHSSREDFFCPCLKITGAGLAAGAEGGMDSCRLSAVVWRKEYILHVTRKKVTDMAVWPCHLSLRLHTSTETKGGAAAADGTTAKAPVCYCSPGLRVCSAGSPCSLSPARLVGHCSSQMHMLAPFQRATF